jgi:hypothetical protein
MEEIQEEEKIIIKKNFSKKENFFNQKKNNENFENFLNNDFRNNFEFNLSNLKKKIETIDDNNFSFFLNNYFIPNDIYNKNVDFINNNYNKINDDGIQLKNKQTIKNHLKYEELNFLKIIYDNPEIILFDMIPLVAFYISLIFEEINFFFNQNNNNEVYDIENGVITKKIISKNFIDKNLTILLNLFMDEIFAKYLIKKKKYFVNFFIFYFIKKILII